MARPSSIRRTPFIAGSGFMGIALPFLGYAVSGRESGRASRLPAGPVAAVREEGGGEARRRSPGAACGVSTATVPPVSPVPVMVWQAWTA